jgi:hypothetical protein
MMDWQNVIQQHPELDVLTVNYEDLKKVRYLLIRDRPFNLKGRGRGGYGFLFRSEFFFRTSQELEYLFFQNLTLGYMTNQNIFFSNIGNQNIFLDKKP